MRRMQEVRAAMTDVGSTSKVCDKEQGLAIGGIINAGARKRSMFISVCNFLALLVALLKLRRLTVRPQPQFALLQVLCDLRRHGKRATAASTVTSERDAHRHALAPADSRPRDSNNLLDTGNSDKKTH
eukprot:6201027-Pleurochrysis_carterae.AAC.5